jgi:hypothetical protein
LANLGSKSETCVGSRVHLVGVSISFEKNFYRLPFTPPLSGSPYRSFSCDLLYFLDCYSRYHQIAIKEEDQEKTAYITPFGAYCYMTMSFGLKNAGATYQ